MQDENFLGTAGPRLMFHINAIAAVDIASFSSIDGEHEFLLLPNTEVVVRGRYVAGQDHLTIIQLDQLPGVCTPPR